MENDILNNRKVLYITSKSEFESIRSNLELSKSFTANKFIRKSSVTIAYWPLFLPKILRYPGIIRFLFWIITLQMFFNGLENKNKSVHFLTYTQYLTPIILSGNYRTAHGPSGTIPRIPWGARCKIRLKLRSAITWNLLAPLIHQNNSKRAHRRAVVHPSIKQGDDQNTITVSSLNVDYMLHESLPKTAEVKKVYDAIFVGRSIPIKNLELVERAFKMVAARYRHKTLIVNSNHSNPREAMKDGVFFAGRQSRSDVEHLIRQSKLHVMLSFELGGYVNLESAVCKVPTLCVTGYGSDYMLKPSASFRLRVENLHPSNIANRIDELLTDANALTREGEAQSNNARRFITENKQKYHMWLSQAV